MKTFFYQWNNLLFIDYENPISSRDRGGARKFMLLHDGSLSDTEHKAVNVIVITDFFYDDPTTPYVPLE